MSNYPPERFQNVRRIHTHNTHLRGARYVASGGGLRGLMAIGELRTQGLPDALQVVCLGVWLTVSAPCQVQIGHLPCKRGTCCCHQIILCLQSLEWMTGQGMDRKLGRGSAQSYSAGVAGSASDRFLEGTMAIGQECSSIGKVQESLLKGPAVILQLFSLSMSS